MNWDKLEELLKNDDLKGFWAAYAQFLLERNIISRPRMLLYAAAKKTSEAL